MTLIKIKSPPGGLVRLEFLTPLGPETAGTTPIRVLFYSHHWCVDSRSSWPLGFLFHTHERESLNP